jgi:hypothetical protein
MHECTVPDGQQPTTQIRGSTGSKYVLGIDPSFSNSPSSDFFAMSLFEIDDASKEGTLVHGYAVAGGDLKDHIKYLYFILSSFDVDFICIDNAGYQFLDSCNENKLFLDARINLKFIDVDTDKEDEDYNKQMIKAKRQYNKRDHRICFRQVFTSNWLRKANEHLQAAIDHKKIWFAAKTTANIAAFNKATSQHVPVQHTGAENLLDLIETQDNLIYQTKKQCALIEVTSTVRGTQTFDLPLHLKRSTSSTRARKDNYTTLMLANWATKVYYDMQEQESGALDTFVPRLI